MNDEDLIYSSAKNNDDLFDEEKNIVHKVYSIKRIPLPNNNEDWEISESGQEVFIIVGSKLLKKERTFLRTVHGCRTVLEAYKSGIRTMNKIKILLKEII